MSELQKLKYDSIFVTGTDTEIGKTFVTTGLVRELERQGVSCAVSKLIAAGAEYTADGWVNEDAVALRNACTDDASYTEVNPICLRAAIAPHIAAQEEGVDLTVQRVTTLLREQRARAIAKQRLLVVEGAGGWLLPLQEDSLADVIAEHKIPVVLVVGMRLGCLNHALLTVASLEQRGVPLLGWVANTCQPESMARYTENLATLQATIAAPLLGEITYQECPEASQTAFQPLATHLFKLLTRR
ncbi:dethiobiotin synthase [Pseudidiomarina aestuarii]|uniref:dethiobiotin synthase n=1 Tax=Pseudidiomarina aestuarii TaxID=624146 RepID=UPI003A96B764